MSLYDVSPLGPQCVGGPFTVIHTDAYNSHLPLDVEPLHVTHVGEPAVEVGGADILRVPPLDIDLGGPCAAPRVERARLAGATTAATATAARQAETCPNCSNVFMQDSLFCRMCGHKRPEIPVDDKNTIRIEMEIKLPVQEKKEKKEKSKPNPKPKPKPAPAPPAAPPAPLPAPPPPPALERPLAAPPLPPPPPVVPSRSLFADVFEDQRFPEPMYFQSMDCVGLPDFFSSRECRRLIKLAEAQGSFTHHRQRVMDLQWADVVDPHFSEAIWRTCGLGWFLRAIVVDGMVPCALNEVIRIHKYEEGSFFGRHTDQPVRRDDGRMSKYSLRVFLNGVDRQEFEGGQSVFHTPLRPDPVVCDAETGLALLYPQGEVCTVQEEMQVQCGVKYMLRADILFSSPTACGTNGRGSYY